MSKFKVGDVCEIIGYVVCPELVGTECEIIESESAWEISAFRGIPAVTRVGFIVRLSVPHPANGGHKCVQMREHLRLKRPPSWNEWLFDTREVQAESQDEDKPPREISREERARLHEDYQKLARFYSGRQSC